MITLLYNSKCSTVVAGILCHRGVSLNLKKKLYSTTIRPALLYGSECRTFRRNHCRKIMVDEMRTLRSMNGHTLKDIKFEIKTWNRPWNRRYWKQIRENKCTIVVGRTVYGWNFKVLRREKGRPLVSWSETNFCGQCGWSCGCHGLYIDRYKLKSLDLLHYSGCGGYFTLWEGWRWIRWQEQIII